MDFVMESLNLPERYKNLTEIGSGGMGKVYKALDQNLGKSVAIKVIRSDLNIISPTSIQRFQKEAKLLGRLKHENLVPILDFNITDKGTPYQVMEYVEGEALDCLISNELTIEESLEIVHQIAEAMLNAHKQGVVHRDLKPSNIIVGKNNNGSYSIKVIDFGIAFQIAAEDGREALTATNAILGSPLYMSPEQSMQGVVDERSDIYSLGTILFQCLTGKLPYQCENALETITLKCKQPAPTLSSLSDNDFDDDIEALVARCLTIDPSNRFQSMNELIENIEQLTSLNHEEIEHVASIENQIAIEDLASSRDSIAKTDKKSWLFLFSIFGIVLLVVGAFLYWTDTSESIPESVGRETLAENAAVERIKEQVDNSKGTYSFRNCPVYRKALKLVADYNDRQTIEFSGSKFRNTSDLLLLKDTNYSQISASHSNLGDAHLVNILKMKNLDTLKMNYTNISTDGIKLISTYRKINYLKLDNMVSDRGLEYLSNLPKLHYLYIRNCENITDRGLLNLSNSKRLVELHLEGCKLISKAGIKKLKIALPNCKIFH